MIVVAALVLAALFGGGDPVSLAEVAIGVAMVMYVVAAARAARAS